MSRCIPMTGLIVEGATSQITEALAAFDNLINNNFVGANNTFSSSIMMQVRNHIIIIVSFSFLILNRSLLPTKVHILLIFPFYSSFSMLCQM